jgi:hypothetical protein
MPRTALLFLLFAAAATAQPHTPEVFGYIGALKLSGDEGSLGSGLALGGGAMLPFTPAWAVDVDVVTARSERFEIFDFRRRRTLLLPTLVHRWHVGRSYLFAGGGVGARIDHTEFGPTRRTEVARAVHFRAGFVVNATGPLLLRGDVVASWTHVVPDFGAKFGVGFRF